MLSAEPLDDRNLQDVLRFIRDVNPFAQETWGWDTGRFLDWRWGSHTLKEDSDPGWLSANCSLFRDSEQIRAVWIADEGGREMCVLTGYEDPATIEHVVDWIRQTQIQDRSGAIFEISDSAAWLADIFRDLGLVEETDTGHEWKYDLSTVDEPSPLSSGFTMESLVDAPPEAREEIAVCFRASFGVERDVAAELRAIESNPMFDPALSLFVRGPDGHVAAYCRGTVDAHAGVCGIDPVCSHPEFQRIGLAKAVVQTCFARQIERGGGVCYIASDAEPAVSTHLYRSLGPITWTSNSAWLWD